MERIPTFVQFNNIEMKVLVTGSNGFLGHQVIFELLSRKMDVCIIVRSTQNIHFNLELVEVFEGNFWDYNTLKTAAHDCDAIVHIAATTSTNLLHYSDYSKINVEGTAQVIKVADDLNINRLVFVSTANTIGFGTEQALAIERFNIEFPFTKSFYAQSKLEAEKLIIQASKKANRHFLIVNPSFMIGAYDTKPSSGKLLIMGYKQRLMFVPKGGKNFVAVSDVAVAICNAMTRGINGERYLASGVNLSFKEYYTLQKQVGKYKQYIIELPNFLFTIIGKMGDGIRKLGVKTEICSMNLNQLKIKEYYSNKKSKTELLLPETNLEIVINEAIEWFKAIRML